MAPGKFGNAAGPWNKHILVPIGPFSWGYLARKTLHTDSWYHTFTYTSTGITAHLYRTINRQNDRPCFSHRTDRLLATTAEMWYVYSNVFRLLAVSL